MPIRNKRRSRWLDATTWPRPAQSELSPTALTRFNDRAAAVEMYCTGKSYAEIQRITGFDNRNVRRLIDRCLAIDPSTGVIYGYFACVEGSRLRECRRTSSITGVTGTWGVVRLMNEPCDDSGHHQSDLG
jgi:hypothetical protein